MADDMGKNMEDEMETRLSIGPYVICRISLIMENQVQESWKLKNGGSWRDILFGVQVG